jgi:hypothetical protein
MFPFVFLRNCTCAGLFRFSIFLWLAGGVGLEGYGFFADLKDHNVKAKLSMAAMMSLFPLTCRIIRLGVNGFTSVLGACWLRYYCCSCCSLRVRLPDASPPSVPVAKFVLRILKIEHRGVASEYEALN